MLVISQGYHFGRINANEKFARGSIKIINDKGIAFTEGKVKNQNLLFTIGEEDFSGRIFPDIIFEGFGFEKRIRTFMRQIVFGVVDNRVAVDGQEEVFQRLWESIGPSLTEFVPIFHLCPEFSNTAEEKTERFCSFNPDSFDVFFRGEYPDNKKEKRPLNMKLLFIFSNLILSYYQ